MSAFNESFGLSLNDSSLLEYEQTLCITNTNLWLLVHFFVVRAAEAFICGPCGLSLLVVSTLCAWRWRYLRNIILARCWPEPDEEYSMFTCLKNEMTLIFVYAYSSFLCTWLGLVNNNSAVTPISFLRWSMEVSNIPVNLLFASVLPCGKFIDNFLDLQKSHHAVVPFTKTVLFFAMRYSESRSDSTINQIRTIIFQYSCEQFFKTKCSLKY